MAEAEIQYVSNESGEPTAVIVPISLWRDIKSERETAYLLKSETMKRRCQGISLDEATEEIAMPSAAPSCDQRRCATDNIRETGVLRASGIGRRDTAARVRLLAG